MKKTLLSLVSLVFLFSCASGHQQTAEKLRKFVAEKNFEEAIEYLKQSPLAEDEKSKLLFYNEMGLLEHYRGNYQASNEHLARAKELLDELYTTRISGKVSSFLSNDNADLYYGEKYEASLVYFYRALNYYLIGMAEQDLMKRRELLSQARSEVVGWDSFLTEMKNERLGQALFKEDLLAKTFGALIHESQGDRKDDQIALQLYKDAQVVFFRNYNLYPTFNRSYDEFRKNFSLFPQMKEQEVAGKYVLETEHTQAFKDFLTHKIKTLTEKLSSGKHGTDGQISFLVQDGLIAEKIPQKYEFPMQWGTHTSMAFTMGMGNKISFELPAIKSIERQKTARLQAIGNDGAVLKEAPLSVISPISELAAQAINEHSASVMTKTAARVATKHIAALVASAATYESARNQQNGGIVMLVAVAGHAAAVAAINKSEKADVRFWSTLPSSIRMGNLNLPKGTYQFRAVFAEGEVVELGTHEVTGQSMKFVMNTKDKKLPENKVAGNVINVPAPERSISSEQKP